ncbi:ribosome maturation factor RimP [Aquibium carbonis]|uniref:Ribosome maturation factor RimP n=1 Tax=Aquibium carbonis TaxID=2495581 RepID=A0A429YXF1_9HYPH|nr:ribosome maturation factor RimP [Aquibium carbonis]RST86120.1 ribosome maturation factor RimP [Aquibium carbonis]
MADTDTQADDRIIRETGTDARVALLIRPLIETMGYRLVRVRLSGQNGMTLQIMAERLDGTMTVQDCEEVSKAISPLLDVEDVIDKAYHLEISSPGIDRPLVRKSDFEQWVGHLIKLETSMPVAERKRFRGKIAETTEMDVVIERDVASYGDEPVVRVPFDAISDARLILTDDLVRDALRADKKARQEQKKRRGEDADGEDDNNAED